MKWQRTVIVTVLCLGLFCGFSTLNSQVMAQGKAAPAAQKITVLNPMGTPPPIQAKPMAARLDKLDGKTIYFVNTGYIGTDRLMDVMMAWFKTNYPTTTTVMKRSGGGMSGVDKALWVEIGEKADAVVIGLGH